MHSCSVRCLQFGHRYLVSIPSSFLPAIWDAADTPPKFYIAPENRWLKDHFPFGKAQFQVLLVLRRVFRHFKKRWYTFISSFVDVTFLWAFLFNVIPLVQKGFCLNHHVRWRAVRFSPINCMQNEARKKSVAQVHHIKPYIWENDITTCWTTTSEVKRHASLLVFNTRRSKLLRIIHFLCTNFVIVIQFLLKKGGQDCSNSLN